MAEEVQHVDKSKVYSNFLVWTVAFTCLVAGLMCNISVKFQNRESHEICEGCEIKEFNAPLWQTFIMFSGEAFCLIAYFVDSKWLAPKKGMEHGFLEFPTEADKLKPKANIFMYAIPTFLDLAGTAVVNIAFTLTFVSTVQMLRNSILIITSCMNLFMLKRPLRVHEWVGITIMTVGLVVSGVDAVMNPDESASQSDKAWIGVVITIAATVINALQIVVEEKIMITGYQAPMKIQGSEGVMGMVMNIVALVIAHYAGFYDFGHAWYQMNNNKNILIGNIWYLIVVGIFNGAGLLTTYVASGLMRTVIYSCRAPVLWVIELIIKWQKFTVAGLMCLILFIAGFMMFAYIIPGVNKENTPAVHKILRKGVDCKCTVPLPDSDDEGEDHDDIDIESSAHAASVKAEAA